MDTPRKIENVATAVYRAKEKMYSDELIELLIYHLGHAKLGIIVEELKLYWYGADKGSMYGVTDEWGNNKGLAYLKEAFEVTEFTYNHWHGGGKYTFDFRFKLKKAPPKRGIEN